MSAADQEYDVCAAGGCHGVPVATWSVRVRIVDIPLWATVPTCATHDGELSEAASWETLWATTVEHVGRD